MSEDHAKPPEDETPESKSPGKATPGDAAPDDYSASLVARLQERYGDALVDPLSVSILPSGSGDATAVPLPGRGGIDGYEETRADGAASDSSPVELSGGRYAAGREIARGGMGAIVEAWDGDLARPLAMKVVLEGHTASASTALVQRFVREARITGQLDHPGIVPVHDIGIDNRGRVYFTMRLVRGEELTKVFARAAAGIDHWNRARALEVILKICDTIAYAHTRGVVHRDLKPLNVMVGEYGEVYVLDWGLAKVLDDSDLTAVAEKEGSDDDYLSSYDLDEETEATIVGTVLGTPSYMPPEQAAGDIDAVSTRLDVYALGALLYTLLAQRAPYVQDGVPNSSRALLEAVRRGPPMPISELTNDVPKDLVALCERAMHRDPEQRFETAADVATALRAHLEKERLAAEESRRLSDQLADSRQISEFLQGLFRVKNPAEAEKPISIIQILDQGAQRIDVDLKNQDAMRASVHATLGQIYHSVGEHASCEKHYSEAIATSRRLDERETLARALSGMAELYRETGRGAEAKALLSEVATLR